MADQVLAIDFGTSNSYFCNCPVAETKPSAVALTNARREGVATALLYRRGREPLVGDAAIEEWGELREAERATSEFRTHFKPDIETSAAARQWSADFLRAVRAVAEQSSKDFRPLEKDVIMGAPSEAPEGFRHALRQVARDAGYGDVRIVDEPVGALLYHLYRQDLSPGTAERGVVVVDFGGGTCDFAYLKGVDVEASWGDLGLGGRLFDDLFFQWYCARHPGVERTFEAQGDTHFMLTCEARRFKERFSETMSRDRSERVASWRPYLGPGRDYPEARDFTWDEFLERAGRYRASDAMRAYLSASGGTRELSDAPDGERDLPARFRDSLLKGLRRHEVATARVGVVLLCGGSSLWPWVPDLVKEFGWAPGEQAAHLFTADRPYAVVAEGLSMLPALQAKADRAGARLRADTPAFLARIRRDLLQAAVRQAVSHAAHAVARDLVQGPVREEVLRFRELGGTIAALKRRIEDGVRGRQDGIRDGLEAALREALRELPLRVEEELAGWFRAAEVKYLSRRLRSPRAGALDVPARMPSDFFAALTSSVDALATALVGVLAGLLLALTLNPAGLLWEVAAGLVLGALYLVFGRRRVNRFLEKRVPVPGFMLRLALTEARTNAKLRAAQDRFGEQLAERAQAAVREPLDRMEQELRERIEAEIRALGALNEIG